MKSRLILLLLTFTFVSLCAPSQLAKPRTSKIVLRFVWLGADFSAPVQNTDVTVSIGGSRFRKQTTRKGWLVLANVPCNQGARIILGRSGFIVRNPGESPMAVSTKSLREITRHIPCGEKPVAVGAFSWEDGRFVSIDMDNIDSCRTC